MLGVNPKDFPIGTRVRFIRSGRICTTNSTPIPAGLYDWEVMLLERPGVYKLSEMEIVKEEGLS